MILQVLTLNSCLHLLDHLNVRLCLLEARWEAPVPRSVICDHVHFSHENEWTQDCSLSPKRAGPWQNPSDTDTGNECSVGGLGSY